MFARQMGAGKHNVTMVAAADLDDAFSVAVRKRVYPPGQPAGVCDQTPLSLVSGDQWICYVDRLVAKSQSVAIVKLSLADPLVVDIGSACGIQIL